MTKFRKIPVTIEAVQWTGKNLMEVIAFTNGKPDIRSTHAGMKWDEYEDLVARDGLKIYTLEGKMNASVGDWIIRGVKGEYYPCKSDIFEATYTPVSHCAGGDPLLLSLKKLTFCLQEWEHDPETMPKAYDQQPRHVQMLMDLIREHEEEKPYG